MKYVGSGWSLRIFLLGAFLGLVGIGFGLGFMGPAGAVEALATYPQGAPIGVDAFNRSMSDATTLGTADVGGHWTTALPGAARVAMAHGVATVGPIAPSKSFEAYLPSA